MLKKITTTISSNHKAIARKAVVLTGVTLGIVIGMLLNKVDDDPDMVIIEELVDAPEDQDDKAWQEAEPKMVEEGESN